MVMTESSNGVSVSQTEQLSDVLFDPRKVGEYIINNPEHSYLELCDLYSSFVVKSIRVEHLFLAHDAIKDYISRVHPGNDGYKAKEELDKEQKKAITTAKLMGWPVPPPSPPVDEQNSVDNNSLSL